MSDLSDLCAKHDLTITYGKGEIREKDDSGRKWRHIRYSVTMKRGAAEYGSAFNYHMGIKDPPRGYGDRGAHGKETAEYDRYLKTRVPDIATVIASLLADASCYDGARDFDDYCASVVVSDDSIRARDTYFECGETSKRIRAFLGDLFQEFQEAAQYF